MKAQENDEPRQKLEAHQQLFGSEKILKPMFSLLPWKKKIVRPVTLKLLKSIVAKISKSDGDQLQTIYEVLCWIESVELKTSTNSYSLLIND